MTEPWTSIRPAAASDFDAAPSSHGVVAVDHAGRCSLLAATGDIRAFCHKRAPTLLDHGVHDVDVRILPCPSMFEAELAYLRTARSIMPEAARAATDRWRSWYLLLDLVAGKWSPGSLESHPQTASSILIGPMPDKHAPTRLGELIDDVFDLCRYPAELAKAPHGRACAYFEMGRCPAPCQGSEPLDVFLARFAEAAAALRSSDALARAIETKMTASAASLDFERASTLRAHLQRLQGRSAHIFDAIADARDWSRVIVIPGNDNQTTIAVVRADGVRTLARVPADTTAAALAPVLPMIEAASAGAVDPPYARNEVEEAWLASRRMFSRRRREMYLTRAEGLDVDTLLTTIRRAPADEDEPETEARADLS